MTHAFPQSIQDKPKLQLKYDPKDVLRVMDILPRDRVLDFMENSGPGRQPAAQEPILRAYYLSRLAETWVPKNPHAVCRLLKANWRNLADLCGFQQVPGCETVRKRFKLLEEEYGNELTNRQLEIQQELEKRRLGKKTLPIILQSLAGSAGLTLQYPVTLYAGPVSNVGNDPRAMEHADLADLHTLVRDGKWEAQVAAVRALVAHKGEKDENGKPTKKSKAYDAAKRRLPFSVVSGHYEPDHRHSPDPQKPNPEQPNHADRFPECEAGGAHPPVPSGIRFLELDDLDEDELAAAMSRIQAHPSVIACWRSPGGRGLHIFVLMDPKPTNNAEAHATFEYATRALGIACIGDASVKNLARLAFVSHDPDAYWNPADPVALVWEVPKNAPQGEKSGVDDDSRTPNKARTGPETDSAESPAGDGKTHPGGSERGGDDADERLVSDALAALAAGQAGLSDNHMLAVMGNMKHLGRTFEEFDQWAAAAGCTCERRGRWDNPPSGKQSNKPGWVIVNLAAAHYGFKFKKGNQAKTGNGGGKAKASANVPPPGWDFLTPDYQAAWLAFVAPDALVVVRNLNANEQDGNITYTLYAVDEQTGWLDNGELMTRYRAKASDAYLLRVGQALNGRDQEREFIACARHARDMRVARTASTIAENVGMSRERFPNLWADIPIRTPLDLDADLSVIGTPSGVWSIPDHRLLTAAEARSKLCSAPIRWDYDPEANHHEATALFEALYGDLVDTTTMEFARWRQAATALVRRPDQEIIVKISATRSGKTTEGNLQINAFAPLVVKGERSAIEQHSGYNTGGSAHNSYLADFARPARRVNVSEVADGTRRQKPLNSQLLRDLSENATITYRDPGPNPKQTVPCDAHLFIDGNMPQQGQDLLQISDPDSDSGQAVIRRLRGSPYVQIPEDQRRSELVNYGNPAKGCTPETKDDIADFNRTIVRLMFDGMVTHWDLLANELPKDVHSRQVISELQDLGKPEWQVKWLPNALIAAGPDVESTNTLAIYQHYLEWHDAHGEGKPASRRAVSDAVKQHYGLQLGEPGHGYLDGKRAATNETPGWVLSEQDQWDWI